MSTKVNKVLGTISCTLGLGIAGALLVAALQTPPVTAANTSSISRLERIVEYADISRSGVYAVCYDGSEFLITSGSGSGRAITVTQVMVRSSAFGSYPKGC